ncbi:MAG: tRNA (cytosine49-C5)-methyltransferase [Patescibacteria group bacterium]|nr:tRNA (cytosine49-C5)-methyltransferase [Patescibacteria group bacterium]
MYLERFSGDGFDAILLDVPCSAEGRIRTEDERTFGFWTERNVWEKAALQSQFLQASFASLRPGGSLVYSTCTLAPEENEGVISSFLSEHPSAVLEACSLDVPEARPGIPSFLTKKYHADIGKTLRILPSDRFEGFYLAKIRKSV